jgi:uncharacterized membrane protein YuzA (DUF378 family)
MAGTQSDHHPTATMSTAGGPGRALDLASLTLLIVGGLNWGLVGLFDVDLVASLFGDGTTLSRVVYALVGLAAVYGFVIAARMAKDRP